MPAPLLPVSHWEQRQQSDCLAACAAMVLDYLGQPFAYDQLLALLDIKADLGAPASNIRNLATLRVNVHYGAGALPDLEARIAQRLPCIAFVNTAHLWYWAVATRHAVVVVGIDEQHVYLNDPAFSTAPQVVSRLEFELAWDDMDNTYGVIALSRR